MKPYWVSDDGAIEVWNEDTLIALDHFRSLGRSFRCVIMDPPYASGSRTETGKATSGAMVRGRRWADRPIDCDQMTTTGFVWLMRETVLAVREMLGEGDSLFAFIDWRQWPNLVGAIESCNFRVNAMIVFADDETDALDFAKAAYPGPAVWKDAEVVDLSALEAGDAQADPPVDPAEGVYQRFVLA